MGETALFPFADDTEWLLRYGRLPLHTGIGKVDRHGDSEHPISRMVRQMEVTGHAGREHVEPEFEASFFVPPAGNCLIFLCWPGKGRLSRNFGEGLTVTGNSPEGPFRLVCPQYHIKVASPIREQPGWAVASPINEFATVSYGEPRPVATVTVTISNFDFEHGNQSDSTNQDGREVLRVVAAGRTVDFTWRSRRVYLRHLVDAGVFGTTSFVTFSFAAWPEATDEELISFAHNISSLCSYVAGQHTGIPILSFLDAEGLVVRRLIRQAVQSKFRDDNALRMMHAERGLPRLFSRCFEEHCRMQQTELWRQLPPLYASIEDPPYLEQKYATLMMAVELLIRNSLIEGGHLSADNAKTKTLPDLIGLARGKLRWHVPGHYTKGERYRKTRNAVDHGGPLPHDAEQVRADFDKWKLFLLRQIFIRLAFDGEVKSPQKGWLSSSPVSEFSEEHNSFGQV